MGKYNTKYFGEISIDETSGFEYLDVTYKNKEINISLSDCNIYGDKLKICLDIMDKYIEINEIAKKAILDNFPEDETVKYYFECHFEILKKEQLMEIFCVDDFEEMDIKNIIVKLGYPNLLFTIQDNEINVSVDYMVSKEYSDEILCVRMDEKLDVTNFSHES